MTTEPTLKVKVLRDPYPHLIKMRLLEAMLMTIASQLEEELSWKWYRRESIGMCLMDPTAPLNIPSTEAVLALLAIGPEADGYLTNAVAKACEHRDHGMDCGVLAYVQPHRLQDGSFRFGHSACVDGTIAGGSALTEEEDRLFAYMLAARFNFHVAKRHLEFAQRNPEGKWYCNDNEPLAAYTAVAARLNA